MFQLFLSKSFTALWAGSSGTLTLTAHIESKTIVSMTQAVLGALLLRLHVGCISAARLWRTLILATFFTCGCNDHLFIIPFLGTVKSVNALSLLMTAIIPPCSSLGHWLVQLDARIAKFFCQFPLQLLLPANARALPDSVCPDPENSWPCKVPGVRSSEVSEILGGGFF